MGVLLYGGSASRLGPERHEALERGAHPLRAVVTDNREEMRNCLQDVVVAARHVPVDILLEAPGLRWYQHWYSGIEDVVTYPGMRNAGFVVTNARGIHKGPVAEQVFGMLLAIVRNIHTSIRNMATSTWRVFYGRELDELDGKRLLVAGLGNVGTRIAELGRAFGMEVIGVRKNARPGLEDLTCVELDKLHETLPTVDIVVCVLPLTPETNRIFDEAAFSRMRRGAIFINFGRGGHVDHEALVSALRSGQIHAAGLDVTDPEPLPPESPLWSMENVIITPHMGGDSPRYGDRIWSLFLGNLERFHEGRELRNVVNIEAGY